MKINPQSEQTFKERKLLTPGVYEFTVFDAIEKISQKSGEPMIEVILSIFDQSDREYKIYDYLMDKPPMDYKIRKLWECVGMIEKYESGEINATDLHDKKGMVKIVTQVDKKGIYDDKSTVKDYLVNKNPDNDDLNDHLSF